MAVPSSSYCILVLQVCAGAKSEQSLKLPDQERLPHRLNLSSRGLDIDSIMCPVCNKIVESNSHVFFSCDTASYIWSLVRGWCDLKIPILSSYGDWDSWYSSWRASKDERERERAYVIFASTSWMLWRFRNNHIFNPLSYEKM
nr:hypothetical protein [Tanacetum cinerariifolium]